MISKSEKQRQREALREEEREEREEAAVKAAARREVVKIYVGAAETGKPFRPEGQVAVVPASSLEKPPPEPPFELEPRQCREILAEGHPRVSFPHAEPCPTAPGDVVDVTSNVRIVVTKIVETVKQWVAIYTVIDSRTHQLGKATGYTGSDQGAIATTKAIEVEGERMGGPEFRPEREQEAVTRKEASDMSNDTRQKRIDKLNESLKELRSNQEQLEELDEGSEVVWGIKKTIKAVEVRITRIETISRSGDAKAA